MPEEKVKLPRSSYDELCKIIKAYGRLEKPAALDEVNSLAGVGKTVVSANNAFLSNVGVIEGGKAKLATGAGKKLAHALEHEMAHDIEDSWRAVVAGNEFLRKMALALKIRKKMEESAFVSHVAYSAGEPKSHYAMTGARAVIDILRASGMVRESDGSLTYVEALEEGIAETSAHSEPGEIPPKIEARPTAPQSGQEVRAIPNVRIELRIEAKPSDLDDLAPKLQKFLRELKTDPAGGVKED